MSASMGPVVVEKFVAARTPRRPCEDILVEADPLFAVVDGAGLPDGGRMEGQRPGLIVAREIALAITRLDPCAPASDAVVALSEAVARRMRGFNMSRRSTQARPAASLVILNTMRREVWRVGTGSVAINGEVSTGINPVEELRSRYRSAVVHAAIALGDVAPEELPDILHGVQHAFQNRDASLGYGVIDGSSVPARFIEVLPIPTAACSLVLATDGYPEVRPSLEATEELLARRNRDDPLGIHFHETTRAIQPGEASFDDRAYLSVRVPAGPVTLSD